jgi:hypothetical protein
MRVPMVSVVGTRRAGGRGRGAQSVATTGRPRHRDYELTDTRGSKSCLPCREPAMLDRATGRDGAQLSDSPVKGDRSHSQELLGDLSLALSVRRGNP